MRDAAERGEEGRNRVRFDADGCQRFGIHRADFVDSRDAGVDERLLDVLEGEVGEPRGELGHG